MSDRTAIKSKTDCEREYKYMHQDRIYYRETGNAYRYNNQKCWKRYRNAQFKITKYS